MANRHGCSVGWTVPMNREGLINEGSMNHEGLINHEGLTRREPVRSR